MVRVGFRLFAAILIFIFTFIFILFHIFFSDFGRAFWGGFLISRTHLLTFRLSYLSPGLGSVLCVGFNPVQVSPLVIDFSSYFLFTTGSVFSLVRSLFGLSLGSNHN